MQQVVFLDFDDTLSDLAPFTIAYTRALGAYQSERFGGDQHEWAAASLATLRAIEDDYIARFVGSPLNGYCEWLDQLRDRAVGQVFESVGRACPPDASRLYQEIQHHALVQCDATFAGTRSAIESLHRSGVRLMLASGQESEFLRSALMGAGVDGFIECWFGPDLVDCAKEGPEYYDRVFKAAGIAAADAIVVDDLPLPILWAVEAGACVIQVRLSTSSHHADLPGVAAILTEMPNLPALIDQVRK